MHHREYCFQLYPPPKAPLSLHQPCQIIGSSFLTLSAAYVTSQVMPSSPSFYQVAWPSFDLPTHIVFSSCATPTSPSLAPSRCHFPLLLMTSLTCTMSLALLLTTQHVSAPLQRPHTPHILLLVLLLCPSSDASLLPPHRSPRRLTGNRCRRHSPRPPLLASTTRPPLLAVSQCHTRQAQRFIIRPSFGSASCWTCRLLDMELLDL